MGAIFLSYRRDDAEGQAGRLYDDLVAVFGPDAVFMDVAAIQPGRDFRKAIEQSLTSCGVFLTLIGKNWLTAQNVSGQRRLDDPADFVRIETAAALKRDIPVIPVLVQGAVVPSSERLPQDLQELAFRNAIELSHSRWDSDVQVLVKALRPLVSTPAAKPETSALRPLSSGNLTRGTYLKLIAAALAILILAVVVPRYLRSSKKAAPPNDAAMGIKQAPAAASAAGTQPAVNHESKTSQAPAETPRDQTGSAAKPRNQSASPSGRFTLGVRKTTLPDNPNRFRFELWVQAPEEVMEKILRVHYDFVYDPNPLSMDGAAAAPFGTAYEGWGCYETVNVTAYFEPAGSAPIKRTFNMCDALSRH